MTARLLLVRHGITAWNREGRFQGHLDPPLADDGRKEAGLLAERLADGVDRPDRIVTSPLQRAATTADLIAGGLGDDAPNVEHDPRLMEIGQGEWEGRTHAELAVEDAERYAAWRQHSDQAQPPGAETIEAVLARVAELLHELAAAPGDVTCVVSHGGIIRLAARHLLGLGAIRSWAMDVDNASLSVLTATAPAPATGSGSAWRVERWNDTAHLLGRAPLHVDESEGEPLAL
ncbi:MAG TPA: histidine phosphatase family protein [Candidatus Limnocylindria bacterium]|nr:histidine phosphatase family protein [Candidatus Limnocylindria bacterium]